MSNVNQGKHHKQQPATKTIAAVAHDLRAEAARILRDAELLEQQVREPTKRTARGSSDVTREARIASGGSRVSMSPTSYFVGDETPASELQLKVEQLIRERPRMLQELIDETGARRVRVSACIIKLQREGARILNLGDERRALWYLPPTGAPLIKGNGHRVKVQR